MEEKKMTKAELWTRLSLYFLLGAAIPFAFLVWKFELFSKTDSTHVGLWGIVAICFTFIFFAKTLKVVRKGMEESTLTQIIDTITSISFPLLVSLFVVWYMKDFMNQLFQFLFVCFVCETAAGIINPLPKWMREHPVSDGADKFTKLLAEVLSNMIKGADK